MLVIWPSSDAVSRGPALPGRRPADLRESPRSRDRLRVTSMPTVMPPDEGGDDEQDDGGQVRHRCSSLLADRTLQSDGDDIHRFCTRGMTAEVD